MLNLDDYDLDLLERRTGVPARTMEHLVKMRLS